MSKEETIPAVERSVTVNASAEKAFSVFTEQFANWWPAGYNINPNGFAGAYIEPRVGGRWFERAPDGTECDWGRVLAWDPPGRVLLSWQLTGTWEFDPDPEHASEVEVRFIAEGQSVTRVEVVHSKFERGVDGEKLADGVGADGGWGTLLGRFTDLVEGREVTPSQ
jgi:uncharacterized protein YndB with AHSA1/START domain